MNYSGCQDGDTESGQELQAAGRLKTYIGESLQELWVRPAHQVPALDAIRAVAVLAVILSHLQSFWVDHVPHPQPGMLDGLIFYYGWTGVDLFFILSGYLIGRQLWKEKQHTGTIGFWNFVMRRGLRIWPLYFATLLMAMAAGIFQPGAPDWLFFSNYEPQGYTRGWTLSTEEQFYIAVPLLLILTPGIRKLEWYFWILGGAIVGVWVARYFTCASLLSSGLPACKPSMVYPIHLHNESLVVGLAIALLSVVRPQYFRPKANNRFSTRGFAILLACWTLAAVLYWLSDMVFAFTAQAMIFGSTALWLLWDRSPLSWPATWRIWYPISRLSYGMYLNHYVFLTGITAWLVTGAVDLTDSVSVGAWVGIVGGIAVSMAFAAFTFVFVERPFLLLRGYWLDTGKQKAGQQGRKVLVDGRRQPRPVGLG